LLAGHETLERLRLTATRGSRASVVTVIAFRQKPDEKLAH